MAMAVPKIFLTSLVKLVYNCLCLMTASGESLSNCAGCCVRLSADIWNVSSASYAVDLHVTSVLLTLHLPV